jgi:benzylsuccinate CoA-transferase BbsF subunit
MLSASLMGSGGPASLIAGYGYHAAGMAGFYDVTGWPDLPPDGPWGAYTDIIVPRFIATLLTAAIDHRRRTGEGQYIEAFQFEMSLHFLAPELADSQVNGHVTKRLGNRSRFAAPHGVYRCAGEDNWCAVAVLDDGQWKALRQLLGSPPWALDRALDSLEGRQTAHDLIDCHLSAWTRRRSAHAAMDELATAGIPAGAVQSSRDLANDAQYAHREFHRVLHHPEMGTVPYAGTQFRIAGYESGPYACAPMFGEHNHQVLTEIAGLSEADITELISQSAVR